MSVSLWCHTSMPDPRKVADELLKKHGCVLVRHNKHEVWLLPNGAKYTRAVTPSDARSDENALRQLRQSLGVNVQRGEPGERRRRRSKPGAQRKFLAAVVPIAIEERYVGLREKLMAIRRQHVMNYEACYPIRKQVVYVSPLTAILRRLFP